MLRRRVWRIAHRGASGYAPEHTRAAFHLALRHAADWIECDARLTADERPVLWHDAQVDRTSDGSGRLRDLTWRQLRRLDCGSWFHRRFAGERALTLEEALRVVRGRARLHVEIKTDERAAPAALAGPIVRCLQRRRAEDQVILSSFDERIIAWIRRRAPRFRCAVITARQPVRALRAAARLQAVAVHPLASLAHPAFVRRAHALGLTVNVWTLDRPWFIRAALARGADGVVSNRPDRVPRWWPT